MNEGPPNVTNQEDEIGVELPPAVAGLVADDLDSANALKTLAIQSMVDEDSGLKDSFAALKAAHPTLLGAKTFSPDQVTIITGFFSGNEVTPASGEATAPAPVMPALNLGTAAAVDAPGRRRRVVVSSPDEAATGTETGVRPTAVVPPAAAAEEAGTEAVTVNPEQQAERWRGVVEVLRRGLRKLDEEAVELDHSGPPMILLDAVESFQHALSTNSESMSPEKALEGYCFLFNQLFDSHPGLVQAAELPLPNQLYGSLGLERPQRQNGFLDFAQLEKRLENTKGLKRVLQNSMALTIAKWQEKVGDSPDEAVIDAIEAAGKKVSQAEVIYDAKVTTLREKAEAIDLTESGTFLRPDTAVVQEQQTAARDYIEAYREFQRVVVAESGDKMILPSAAETDYLLPDALYDTFGVEKEPSGIEKLGTASMQRVSALWQRVTGGFAKPFQWGAVRVASWSASAGQRIEKVKTNMAASAKERQEKQATAAALSENPKNDPRLDKIINEFSEAKADFFDKYKAYLADQLTERREMSPVQKAQAGALIKILDKPLPADLAAKEKEFRRLRRLVMRNVLHAEVAAIDELEHLDENKKSEMKEVAKANLSRKHIAEPILERAKFEREQLELDQSALNFFGILDPEAAETTAGQRMRIVFRYALGALVAGGLTRGLQQFGVGNEAAEGLLTKGVAGAGAGALFGAAIAEALVMQKGGKIKQNRAARALKEKSLVGLVGFDQENLDVKWDDHETAYLKAARQELRSDRVSRRRARAVGGTLGAAAGFVMSPFLPDAPSDTQVGVSAEGEGVQPVETVTGPDAAAPVEPEQEVAQEAPAPVATGEGEADAAAATPVEQPAPVTTGGEGVAAADVQSEILPDGQFRAVVPGGGEAASEIAPAPILRSEVVSAAETVAEAPVETVLEEGEAVVEAAETAAPAPEVATSVEAITDPAVMKDALAADIARNISSDIVTKLLGSGAEEVSALNYLDRLSGGGILEAGLLEQLKAGAATNEIPADVATQFEEVLKAKLPFDERLMNTSSSVEDRLEQAQRFLDNKGLSQAVFDQFKAFLEASKTEQ